VALDAPLWSIEDWNPGGFPARFDTSRQELTLYEIRPTIAWAIDDRWSLGGALRYVRGDLETSFSSIELFSSNPNLVEPGEVLAEAASDVDAIGFELALHYAAESWGAGLVLSPGMSLEGDGEIDYALRDPLHNPGPQLDFDLNFAGGDATLDFELPPTASAGFWWSLSPNFDMEVDLAWAGWSALDRTRIAITPEPFADDPPALDRRRDWEDTLSVRVGAEMLFGDGGETGWSAGAGLAWEPSPVPDATLEPGFPRGDAYVLALGASYGFEGLSFDLGYSYWFYEDRDAVLFTGVHTGALAPVTGTYSARAQVFSISARWRK
jgi:long-chain fatty acid transport protein